MSEYGQPSYQLPDYSRGTATPDFWETEEPKEWKRRVVAGSQTINPDTGNGGSAEFWSSLPTDPLGMSLRESFGTQENGINLPDYLGGLIPEMTTSETFNRFLGQASDEQIQRLDQSYGGVKSAFQTANQYYVDALAAGEPLKDGIGENQAWLKDAWSTYADRRNELGLS